MESISEVTLTHVVNKNLVCMENLRDTKRMADKTGFHFKVLIEIKRMYICIIQAHKYTQTR